MDQLIHSCWAKNTTLTFVKMCEILNEPWTKEFLEQQPVSQLSQTQSLHNKGKQLNNSN